MCCVGDPRPLMGTGGVDVLKWMICSLDRKYDRLFKCNFVERDSISSESRCLRLEIKKNKYLRIHFYYG